MQLPIVQKAFLVYDPNYFNMVVYIDYELVYAETSSKAKSQCTSYKRYIDIKAKRDRDRDKVLYNGQVMLRENAKLSIKDAQRKKEQLQKLLLYDDKQMFYVQNGYVGNSVSFWALGSGGYTIDILKAQKYTRKQIIDQFIGGREEDRIWLASEVEKKIVSMVDGQYLDSKFRI